MKSQRDAILLLTVSLGGKANKEARPLSPKEWAKFASWLHEKNLTPASLIDSDLGTLLAGWVDQKINRLRLEKLLDRGAALGLALEKWSRAGLWVITRSDNDYPKRLLKRLGKTSPPVLFGCGNKKLLNSGGVSVVGSRNASEEDSSFSEQVGRYAANSGLSVVSGGARGVDQLAMFGALNAGGTVVGVLSDSLLTSATSAKYRKFIMKGDLVLVSPFNPEAGFNVGNAMGRNRYIYCLSDAAVVVCSTTNKGGTWNGAIENLSQNWVPIWVKKNTDSSSGNNHLYERGARWFPDKFNDLNVLKTMPDTPEINNHSTEVTTIKDQNQLKSIENAPAQMIELDFYKVFLVNVEGLTRDGALKAEEIATKLDVSKSQISLWIKRAVEDQLLVKKTKPVRYKYKDGCSNLLDMI